VPETYELDLRVYLLRLRFLPGCNRWRTLSVPLKDTLTLRLCRGPSHKTALADMMFILVYSLYVHQATNSGPRSCTQIFSRER
jgi:hypothetical protein